MDNNKIGLYLQNKRKEKNITQKELADIMGVTYQAVSRWEKGDSIPDLDSLDNLANFYKISIDDILQRKVENNNKDNTDNFKYIVTMIISAVYILGLALFGLLYENRDTRSWGYFGLVIFLITGLLVHNIYFIMNKSRKNILKWYFLTYLPLLLITILVLLVETDMIR